MFLHKTIYDFIWQSRFGGEKTNENRIVNDGYNNLTFSLWVIWVC
jgi:hypothetical protein